MSSSYRHHGLKRNRSYSIAFFHGYDTRDHHTVSENQDNRADASLRITTAPSPSNRVRLFLRMATII